MHGKSTIKSLLKLSFLSLQAFYFILGITVLVVALLWFIKERILFSLPFSLIIFTILLSTLHILCSIFGFISINSGIKVRIAFYILCILALINLEVIILAKLGKIKSEDSSTKIWNKMTSTQHEVVENALKCKGEECEDVFKNAMDKGSQIIIKWMVALVMIDSISLGLLTLLKLRK